VLKLLTRVDLFEQPCALTYFITIKSGVAFLAEISDKEVMWLAAFAFPILG